MGVFDIEAGRFHSLEGRFYLPSLFVCPDRALRPIKAYEKLQFGNTIGILDTTNGNIDLLAFMKKKLVVKFLLADAQVIEQPPSSYTLIGKRLDYPEVLSYSDVIPYATILRYALNNATIPFIFVYLYICIGKHKLRFFLHMSSNL